MGAGRKTETYTLSEKSDTHWTTVANCLIARNLKKSDLGGVIFGCKNNTIHECYSRKLFGLPSPHFSYVKNIVPGLPLFLFNYSDKMLHGIFESTSDGQLRIDSRAWTGDEFDTTPFPAQVRIRVRTQCRPLSEKQFGPIIKDNYCDEKHFYFELDRAQTEKLIAMFLSFKTISGTSSAANADKRMTQLRALSVRSNTSNDEDASSQYDSNSDLAEHMAGKILSDKEEEEVVPTSRPVNNSWSSLFKGQAGPDAGKKIQNSNSSVPDNSIHPSGLRQNDWGLVSPRFDPGFGNKMNSLQGSHLGPIQNSEVRNSFNPVVGSTSLTRCSSAPLNNTIENNSAKASEDLDRQSRQAFEVVKEVVDKRLPPPGFLPNGQSTIGTNNDLGQEARIPGVTSNDIHTQGRNNFALQPEASYMYAIMVKLLSEVSELRLSRVDHEKKICTLEQDTVKLRLEIQLLREKCNSLECKSSNKTGNLIVEEPKLSNDHHRKLEGSILVIGGHNGASWVPDTSCYHPSLDRVEPRSSMNIVLPHSSATKLNGEIYVLGGGGSGQVWQDAVEQYNPLNDQWTKFPSLSQKKGNLAAVSFNDKIYAIGGGNGLDCFSDVEMYLLDLGMWIPTVPMLKKRYSLAAAEISGSIYVVGGYDRNDYLSSVERFDPRERSWVRLENMRTKRGCHSVVVLNDKLFALGGYDGERFVSTVEVFDPRKGSWMVGDCMKNCRSYSASVVIGDSIYVLGGLKDDCQYVDTVERYEEGFGWQVTNLKGIGQRWSFSNVAL